MCLRPLYLLWAIFAPALLEAGQVDTVYTQSAAMAAMANNPERALAHNSLWSVEAEEYLLSHSLDM